MSEFRRHFMVWVNHLIIHNLCRNQSVKQHINTTRGLFPHKRVKRRTEMTAEGPSVVEQDEGSSSGHQEVLGEEHKSTPSSPSSPERKSAIELIYMRWMEGLKFKWPRKSRS